VRMPFVEKALGHMHVLAFGNQEKEKMEDE
jgi:hypothetical protein